MRLKTFRAFTLDEALAAVHDDLGSDAAILHTRTFRRGGLFGIGGRELVEIIASEVEPDTSILPAVTRPLDHESPAEIEDAGAPQPIERGVSVPHPVGRARQAYASMESEAVDPLPGSTPVPSSPSDATLSSGSLVVDRDRTRALARAMEIRLDRQRAAREAAGVEGPDDLVGTEPESRVEDVEVPDAAVEASAPETPVVEAPKPAATSFVIGPGGVLVPEGDETGTTEPSAPRVIALEPAAVTRDEVRGIPVVSTTVEASEPQEGSAEPKAAEEIAGDAVVETAAVSPPGPSAESSVKPPESTDDHQPDAELQEIGRTVRKVLDRELPVASRPTNPEDLGFADPLASAYAEMIGQEFSRDLADRVVETLEGSLDEQSLRDPAEVRKALLREIADLVPTEESLEVVVPRDGRPRTIAFVGPTGVGKTTTLAKIAATLSLREGLKVGLVTADTYRISAVEQLRTYAEILGCRLEVAGDPATMKKVLAECEGLDAVLIDTPGRSQNDTDSLAELRTIMDAARPHETHLVLAGTAAERVLLREAEAFAGLGPDRVVLTKLDEAVAFGMLVSVVRRIGRRISWVTTGQEVPRDVEWATGSRIADLVLGGAVKS